MIFGLIAAAGMMTDMPGKMKDLYDKSVETGQYVATAGDLRSISNMLDYEYMRRGRYPRSDNFVTWMAETFKENHLKSLTSDHWGQVYIYQATSDLKFYTLISSGPDGVPNSEDDLKITGP